ncbi:MAG TPA: ATP-binding protein [Candidatus Sulfotelmatobacter sp.]|nr:ATP-binding protein [Candidatus Sulfotelmatobacter sp.]
MLISWRRSGDLQGQLSAKKWESFQIADHLQQAILGLNNQILRYAAYRDDVDWTNFSKDSQDLDRWLNQQRPILSSQKEQPFLDSITATYPNYLAAADAINTKLHGTSQPVLRIVDLADLEKQSKRILDLGFKLSEAHQQSIDQIQSQNHKSLNLLRGEMLAGLLALVIVIFYVAVMVYRETIAPLQVQLVESRQLVERQEKLASLGMLAAGIAHEIRNPLTSIKAWLYLQQKHLKRGTPEFADAEVIGGEINRLERIVKDFLHFARPSEPEFAVMSAEQPLREVLTLLQPELEKSGIKLVLGETVPAQIRADPQQLKQVLINLVQNAADSVGRDGTVTLRAQRDEKFIHDRSIRAVILEISDTGRGISPEAEKRLFDPFFTTKDYGTGLGLPIAARIVEKHGGALQYRNLAQGGAAFGIVLPEFKS